MRGSRRRGFARVDKFLDACDVYPDSRIARRHQTDPTLIYGDHTGPEAVGRTLHPMAPIPAWGAAFYACRRVSEYLTLAR